MRGDRTLTTEKTDDRKKRRTSAATPLLHHRWGAAHLILAARRRAERDPHFAPDPNLDVQRALALVLGSCDWVVVSFGSPQARQETRMRGNKDNSNSEGWSYCGRRWVATSR